MRVDLQKAAVEHFACQDGKVGLTVHCEDTFGNEHTILHRFWTNSKYVRSSVLPWLHLFSHSNVHSSTLVRHQCNSCPAWLKQVTHVPS